MATAPLLDRQFLEKLERLTIQWQKSFAGLVGGHQAARFAGAGLEFFEHRHFHHGDDLRAVNWRAYMRLEKLFLKMFQVEPRVPVHLLVDCSLSMTTGESGKFDQARRIAAALCYVGLVRLDTIAVIPFSGALGDKFLCGGGRHRFSPVLEFLTALEPGGRTDFLKVARQFLSSHHERGLLVIISDFLDDADCAKPLQYLADFGHELLLIQVWSDQDRQPPWLGELELTDAESGESLRIWVDEKARESYTRAFDSYRDALEELSLRNSGRYVGVSDSMPIEEVIFDSLVRARGFA